MFNYETSTHFQWKIPFGTRQLIPASPHFSKDFAKNLAIGWNSVHPVVAARMLTKMAECGDRLVV